MSDSFKEKLKTIEDKTSDLLSKGIPQNKIDEFKKEIMAESITPFNAEVWSSDKLLKEEIPPSEFIIEKLLPRGGITMLSGNPGNNKSWLALFLCREIGSATWITLNRFNILKEPIKVLYVDEETPFIEIKRRWLKLNPPLLTQIDFMAMAGFKLDNESQRKEMINFCKYRRYGLIVFDSLRDMFSGNENDSETIQKVIDYLKEFTRLGITMLLIHHNRKESPMVAYSATQALRGSSAILAGLDSLITVERAKQLLDGDIELTISQSKLRQGLPTKTFKIKMAEDNEKGLIDFSYLEEIENEETKVAIASDALVEYVAANGEVTGKEITNEMLGMGYSTATIRRAIAEMEEKSILLFSGWKKRSKMYQIRATKSDGFVGI